MSKSYVFTLNKYYNDEELSNVAPIIENYVNFFADENGVAKLQLKNDVSVVVKKDEGLALHMVLDNPDNFTALPKKLTKARDFLQVFITAMAKAVDEQVKKNASVADAKAKVETEAENSLLNYIGGDKADVAEEPKAETTVKVNGKEITDPEEKAKVEAEVDEEIKAARERLTKVFNDTFDKVMKTFTTEGWLNKYLN